MSNQIAVDQSQPRKFASTLAIGAGFVTVFILSLATDQLLHIFGVYPPWGEPMRGTGQNLLALSYRVVYAVLGSYIAARLAPRNPMRHAMILGAIGLVLSTLGAAGGIAADLGPLWFPIALVLTTLPCAWLGGFLYEATTGNNR